MGIAIKKGKAVVKVDDDTVKTDELVVAVEKTGFYAKEAKK